ncbi:hypothetical protein ACQP2P_22380 [Dactylosporangium sp. CA-139114]|uniref:hypothetical protein n=1 Tax=Dactylosporangium sp. CA-139114 TaxID=3239931 RepID=UPI003D96AFF4
MRPAGGDDEALLELIPHTVARLREADPGAHWAYRREAYGFELRFHCGARAARRLGLSVAPVATGDGPAHPQLSTIASDLALALARRGEPSADTALPMAVRHLRTTAGLIAPGERRPFLFECWRYWSAGLGSGVRLKLMALAEQPVPEPCADDSWTEYHRALAGLGEVTGPMKYTLFRLADGTLNRLGVPRADQALAALVVRRLP